jgi:hypothetical protein
MAMCVLHNFLLATGDTWTPTEADLALIKELDKEFHENVLHSPWAQMIVAGETTGRGDEDTQEGKAKRARLMAVLLDHARRAADSLD